MKNIKLLRKILKFRFISKFFYFFLKKGLTEREGNDILNGHSQKKADVKKIYRKKIKKSSKSMLTRKK